jgi:alpha-D-ribose 1-methylphosphonate 5-triphosphate synthase subunit PhnL
VLSVEGLSKRFALHALGGRIIEGCPPIGLEVPAGAFVALAGPSGSGKSTVLKCIYRTYLPTAGHIRYRSARRGVVDLATASDRLVLELRAAEIGFVSQFLRVIPRVPALEVVAQPLLDAGVPPDRAREEARDVLDRLRIPRALHDASPATFSGGEQQRVNIARALARAPRLLLLDEPTASLDAASASLVLAELRALQARGTTILGVFHDHALIAAVADRVVHTGAEGQAHA